jgi:hypothetical protein
MSELYHNFFDDYKVTDGWNETKTARQLVFNHAKSSTTVSLKELLELYCKYGDMKIPSKKLLQITEDNIEDEDTLDKLPDEFTVSKCFRRTCALIRRRKNNECRAYKRMYDKFCKHLKQAEECFKKMHAGSSFMYAVEHELETIDFDYEKIIQAQELEDNSSKKKKRKYL